MWGTAIICHERLEQTHSVGLSPRHLRGGRGRGTGPGLFLRPQARGAAAGPARDGRPYPVATGATARAHAGANRQNPAADRTELRRDGFGSPGMLAARLGGAPPYEPSDRRTPDSGTAPPARGNRPGAPRESPDEM